VHALPLEPQRHVHRQVFPALGSVVPGSGFRASETQDSGFRERFDSGFRVSEKGRTPVHSQPSSQSVICKGDFQRWTFRVQVSRFRVRGSGFRFPGFGFCTPVHAQTLEPEGAMQRRVLAVGATPSVSGFQVQVSGFWVAHFTFQVVQGGPVHAQTLEPERDMQRRIPAVYVARCHICTRLLSPL